MGKTKKTKEKRHPVVYMCKGGFHLNSTYIAINLYYQLNLTYEEQYIGSTVELEQQIIDDVMSDPYFLEDLFPIDKRYFKDIYVDGDDCYERELDDSYIEPNPDWTYRKFLWGGYKDVTIDGETYKVAIRVSREWFDNEEHKN